MYACSYWQSSNYSNLGQLQLSMLIIDTIPLQVLEHVYLNVLSGETHKYNITIKYISEHSHQG